MVKYLHYLMKTMSKKWSIRISLILGTIISGYVMSLHLGSALGSLEKVETLPLIFPFIFTTIFSVFVVTHSFKDGEIDGSELLIVAKPIKRFKIVMTKYISVLIALIIFQVLFFVFVYWGTNKVIGGTTAERIKFTFSITIGGLIVQLLMLGIITLLASSFGKVGTLVISIVLSVFIPIISMIMDQISNKTFDSMGSYDGYAKQFKYGGSDDKVVKIDDYSNFKTAVESKDKYIKSVWIDPWYQWSGIYGMFLPQESDNRVGEKTTAIVPSEYIYDVQYTDNQNQPKQVKLTGVDKIGFESYDEDKRPKVRVGDEGITEVVKNYITNNNNLTGSAITINHYDIIEKLNDLFKNYIQSGLSKSIDEYVLSNYVSGVDIARAMKEIQVQNNVKYEISQSELESESNNFVITDPSGAISNLYEVKPYGNKTVTTTAWIIITLSLLTLSGYIYMRRDFK